jgi:hypothetical protein
MKKTVLSVLVALGLSSAAMAQDAATDFAALDADASGGLSLTEVQAAMPDVTAEAFATADADVSGELSEDEYATLAPAM